jgi:hypothetical protein
MCRSPSSGTHGLIRCGRIRHQTNNIGVKGGRLSEERLAARGNNQLHPAWPRLAKLSATARPMPVLPSVTMTTLSLNVDIMFLVLG